jgi:hypothetical protein
MAIHLYVRGRSALKLLSLKSAEEYLARQHPAVRDGAEIRITRERRTRPGSADPEEITGGAAALTGGMVPLGALGDE